MDKNKYKNNQEWLRDTKERNRRFGDLGLSQNDRYSDLSAEEQYFLDMDNKKRSFIEESYYIKHRMASTDKDFASKRQYVRRFVIYYNYFSESFSSPDSKSNDSLNLALTDAIMNLDIPDEKIRKIILMMSADNTPNFAKQMVAFKIQHPFDKLSEEYTGDSEPQSWSTGFGYQRIMSLILDKTIFHNKKIEGRYGEYNTEEIIYRDLIKCAFESGGRNISCFLNKLSGGDYMMHAIMRWPDSDEAIGRYYSKKDLDDLQTLIRQLHSMHYQTKSGEKEEYDPSLHNMYNDYGGKTITQVKEEIRTIYDEYKPDEKYGLGDRVIQSFCYPLGIRSISEAREYLYDVTMRSQSRHDDDIREGKVGKINKGDFVKSIGSSDYLPYLLENGVLSREYLGVGAHSDATPLDTDVSKILEEPKGLRDAISKTSAAYFSAIKGRSKENVFLIFRGNGRFTEYDYDTMVFDEDKYEVCGPGRYVTDDEGNDYYDDYGIRTGIPSSEIDYIATDKKSATKVIEAVRESNLFIPVTDLDGNLLYNPFKY